MRAFVRALLVSLVVLPLMATVLIAAFVTRSVNEPPMTVHEWGTFTALQDEQGQEISGVHVDDEPVPAFVHRLKRTAPPNPFLFFDARSGKANNLRLADTRVTIRLETPVIYFYPPAGHEHSRTIDVDVEFRGGLLSEFYPNAEAGMPASFTESGGSITEETVGKLTWKGLRVGTSAAGPETEDHVWLAPRQVAASPVTASNGESEKYLFYRGVGNFRAPLRVSTDLETNDLAIRGNFDKVLASHETAQVNGLWLVQIRADGAVAYRRLDALEVNSDTERILTTISANFDKVDFDAANFAQLQSDMHAALVADGLFADEAAAMLSTWEHSYFKSPGQRLFFLVPRPWTDHHLPIQFSTPVHLQRVMMGRIELITPQQRALLNSLAKGPVSNPDWLSGVPDSVKRDRFRRGAEDLKDLNVDVPSDFQNYLNLGRFRDALVIAEANRSPAEPLQAFMKTYGVHPFASTDLGLDR